MDTTDPTITFDADGVCQYVHAARSRLQTECFHGPEGERLLGLLVDKIKSEGHGKEYDCIAGISGGVDSSYTLIRAKELGLRPLAVHLDNGWNSELAVSNIEHLLRELDIDLHTHVVDWEEMRDLQRAFFLASVANVEVVSDHAITAIVYQEAVRHGTRFILSGSNVATESIMPDSWGYDPRDARHIRAIHRHFGSGKKLKTYPILPAATFVWNILARRMRHIPLLNYGPYVKRGVIARLQQEYGWVPYKRKHGESRFTRFFQEYYLPEKFGYDKRRAHLSSLIVSGQLDRASALAELQKPLYEPREKELEVDYVIKKLGFTRREWTAIMSAPERSYTEFSNNAWMFDHSSSLTRTIRQIAKGEGFGTPRKASSRSSALARASRTICHLSFAPFVNESRAIREASSALASGFAERVLFVGYDLPGAPSQEYPMPDVETIRLRRPNLTWLPRASARGIQWVWWSMAVANRLRNSRFAAIQCHSLAALPIGVLLKLHTGSPLIYDAHELETERPGWGSKQKTIARLIERAMIRHCDHTITVSTSILNWYRDTYQIEALSLLRNVPQRPDAINQEASHLRTKLGIPNCDIVFIYLGLIDHGRGYRILIEAFREIPKNKHLVFLGDGSPAALREVADATRNAPNIHWHPPVPNSEVVHYATGADVGLSIIEDVCLSYRYCLPNKVHECRLAGLPLIVSDLPELANFINETNCGWTIAPRVEDLRRLIGSLDDVAIRKMKSSATAAPLTWSEEQKSYLHILRELISKPAS